MAEYQAPLKDMQFLLYDVFKAENQWAAMSDLPELGRDLADAILQEGAKLAEQVFFPLNATGDEQGCRLEAGKVITPDGFKAAYQHLVEGGWLGLSGDPAFEGQGMPKMLVALFEEMMFASNSSLTLYVTLSLGAGLALSSHGSEEQKRVYLEKLYQGSWSGTMCLTEPHSGTDLGILRTKAASNGDGSYAITGSKIFITSGDHDLTENVMHLVLAKLPDAPEGTRGISMFLVPKFLVDSEGQLGDRNSVSVGSLEHKMGIKGSATCVMNFDGAKGWLVGEPHQGLAAMFTMMNYERLTTGIQGVGSADMAYQHALAYAKERLQGRSPRGAQYPEQPADPIIVHPDVRRMLLTIKAYTEGSRAFVVYTGLQLDLAAHAKDDAQRQRAEQLAALLTPVAKAYLSDRGFDSCVMAQQVLGGHGYVKEWGVEQLVRDARIAQIYEGTNGVQAMDLVGRKIYKTRGALLRPLLDDIRRLLAKVKSSLVLQSMAETLDQASLMLEETTEWLVDQADRNPNILGASAVEYLELVGLVSFAYLWLNMAKTAIEENERDGQEFYLSKLATAQFFYEKLLPKALSLGQSIQAGSQSTMQLSVEQF